MNKMVPTTLNSQSRCVALGGSHNLSGPKFLSVPGPRARSAWLPPSQPSCPAREKAQELSDWIHQLESEKFDLMAKLKQQKYEVRPSSAGREGGREEGQGWAGRDQQTPGRGGWPVPTSPPAVPASVFCLRRSTCCTTASATPRSCECDRLEPLLLSLPSR